MIKEVIAYLIIIIKLIKLMLKKQKHKIRKMIKEVMAYLVMLKKRKMIKEMV